MERCQSETGSPRPSAIWRDLLGAVRGNGSLAVFRFEQRGSRYSPGLRINCLCRFGSGAAELVANAVCREYRRDISDWVGRLKSRLVFVILWFDDSAGVGVPLDRT